MLRLLTVLFALLQLSSGLQLGGVRANVQLRRSVSPLMGVSFKVGDTVEMITGDYKGAPARTRQQAAPRLHWPQLGAPSQPRALAAAGPSRREHLCGWPRRHPPSLEGRRLSLLRKPAPRQRQAPCRSRAAPRSPWSAFPLRAEPSRAVLPGRRDGQGDRGEQEGKQAHGRGH